MRYVPTPDATVLTGLSTATLREWTSRRALIPADVPPKSKESPAIFTWKINLLLRIAAKLRNRYHLELQLHKSLFASLKAVLRRTSFIALWGKILTLQGGDRWFLMEGDEALPLVSDAITIVLQLHLEALSIGFALLLPSILVGQLNLFPARLIDSISGPLILFSARTRNADTFSPAGWRSA